jgi:hypothetical protein
MIVASFFMGYSMIYIYWFIAKSIATVENQKKIGFDAYSRYFFLVWIFPIGIWWMHPKVKKIFSNNNTPLV